MTDRATIAAPPRGREEVCSALIAAAAELSSEGIPALISVRDIAARANVNHGLVHQYFGSKDALIAATIEHLARERAAIVERAPDEATAVHAALRFQHQNPAYTRLLAWWLLEGRDISELDLRFGPIRDIVDSSYDSGSESDRINHQIVSAGVGLIMLGSVIFREFVDAYLDTNQIGEDQYIEGLAKLASSIHHWNSEPQG
jgi:AcrR family transcriptional regulator